MNKKNSCQIPQFLKNNFWIWRIRLFQRDASKFLMTPPPIYSLQFFFLNLGEPGSSNGFKMGKGICSVSASTECMLSSSLLDSEHVVNTVYLLSRQWACCRDSALDVRTIGMLFGQWVCCQDRGPVVETVCLLSRQWTCCQDSGSAVRTACLL